MSQENQDNTPADDVPQEDIGFGFGDSEDAEMMDAIAAAFGEDALDMLDESVELDPHDNDSLARAAADLAGGASDLDEVVREIDSASAGSTQSPASRQNESGDVATDKMVIVELGDSVFGIPMVNVHEIQRVPSVTSLPNVPAWVLGVANLRGNILSVVDLRLMLGMPCFEGAPTKRRLVVTQSLVDEVDSGFIVDRVIGVRQVASTAVHPPTSPVNDQIEPFLYGVAEIDDALVALLDVDKLMLSEEFRQFEPV